MDILAGKADCEILSGEEKWCTLRKKNEKRKGKKVRWKTLSLLLFSLFPFTSSFVKEEGIMRAERAAAKIDRDYEKFARRLAEDKNRLDIALRREAIRRASHAEGHAEGRAEGILEIARKMKNAGRPLSEIMEFTGLPSETIEQIRTAD